MEIPNKDNDIRVLVSGLLKLVILIELLMTFEMHLCKKIYLGLGTSRVGYQLGVDLHDLRIDQDLVCLIHYDGAESNLLWIQRVKGDYLRLFTRQTMTVCQVLQGKRILLFYGPNLSLPSWGDSSAYGSALTPFSNSWSIA